MISTNSIQQLKQQPRLGVADFSTRIKNIVNALGNAETALEKSRLISFNQALSTGLQSLGQEVSFFENRISALNKNFGITSQAAQKVNVQLISQATTLNTKLAKGYKISNLEMQKYAIGLKKMLPTLNQASAAFTDASITKQMLQTQRIMRSNLKLSDKQANSYTQFAAASEQGAAAQLRFQKAFAHEMDPDGTLGYFNMISEEIADAGSAIQLQYGSIPGSLEGAVIKAKKLGFTLGDVTKIGEKMLNIESSVGDELEYQLLSGKRLVDQETGESFTNKLRMATMQGDASAQAETLNKIIAQQGDGLEKNLFARKQLAKTLGIEEKQLAGAIQKQKILDKYSKKYGIKLNVDDDGAMKAAASELAKTGEITATEFKEFNDQTDQRTSDDLMKEQLLVARESKMLHLMNNLSIKELRKTMQNIAKGGEDNMMEVDSGLASTIVGAKATLDFVSNMMGSLTNSVDTAVTQENAIVEIKDDFKMSPVGLPGYQRVLSGPEGSFAINDKDTITGETKPDTSTTKLDDSNIVSQLKIIASMLRGRPGTSFNGARNDY